MLVGCGPPVQGGLRLHSSFLPTAWQPWVLGQLWWGVGGPAKSSAKLNLGFGWGGLPNTNRPPRLARGKKLRFDWKRQMQHSNRTAGTALRRAVSKWQGRATMHCMRALHTTSTTITTTTTSTTSRHLHRHNQQPTAAQFGSVMGSAAPSQRRGFFFGAHPSTEPVTALFPSNHPASFHAAQQLACSSPPLKSSSSRRSCLPLACAHQPAPRDPACGCPTPSDDPAQEAPSCLSARPSALSTVAPTGG